jgi:hypothetical protein
MESHRNDNKDDFIQNIIYEEPEILIDESMIIEVEDGLEAWQWDFKLLNEKLGNDVWGARIETDIQVHDEEFVRMFVSNNTSKEKVIELTNGIFAGRKIFFTILLQDNQDIFLANEV